MKPPSYTYLAILLLLPGCSIPDRIYRDNRDGSFRSANLGDLNKDPYKAKSRYEVKKDENIDQVHSRFLNQTLAEHRAEGREGKKHIIAADGIAGASWYLQDLHQPFLNSGHPATVDLNTLYQQTLAHSTQVQVFGNIPLIRATGIDEARGAFDGEVFTSTRFEDLDEPTGSILETGGPDYFKQKEWVWESGVRKRLHTGTELSVSQEVSRTRNNSEFFVPDDQGDARLKLRISQPILRGAGVTYNESVIQIAKLDHEIGYQEFLRQLETHLAEVNRSYWSLYLARAIYLEKSRVVRDTESIVEQLNSRGNLDTMASQNARVQSAHSSRLAEMIRAELAIKNAESRLRALVNDPGLIEQGIGELIPSDRPLTTKVSANFEKAVQDAVKNRPEVLQAENQLRASNVRERMAKQDKLPQVDLFAEGWVSALEDDGAWDEATGSQFDDSDPSWAIGMTGSMSIERRFQKARHLRSQLETRQQEQRLKSTLETVRLEVQVAFREVTTAYPDMLAKFAAVTAAEKDLSVVQDRQNVDGNGGNKLTSEYLEYILEAQDRLQFAREQFLQAMVVYNVALTNLERAKGTLVRGEGIEFGIDKDAKGLPAIHLTKAK